VRKLVGKGVDLRIDANEAWDLEMACRVAQKLEPFSISSIEQPLPHKDLMQMAKLRKVSPIPLMLDESLCSLSDAQQAVDKGFCDLFNIRLSKCGGFINSLKIAQLARQNGLGYQLGCLVGETGILSAAGRHFASLDSSLRYLEGSYDRYLLKDNITFEDISFGKKGRAPLLEGNGLGITVNPNQLDLYSIYKKQIVG
jgi:muconate cycloisomerase